MKNPAEQATVKMLQRAALSTSMLLIVYLLVASPSAHAQAYAQKVLYSFTGGEDGGYPVASLLLDSKGDLFGTTEEGGDAKCGYHGLGCGVVFKLDSAGDETVLYTFAGPPDLEDPTSGLVMDAAGNLYGTTIGNSGNGGYNGAVYEITASGKEKTLFVFQGTPDGSFPFAALLLDAKGYLYGTTRLGGASNGGTVFRLSQTGKEKILYSFSGFPDAWGPWGGVISDAKGNFYGMTEMGGSSGAGAVFKLTRNGKETVLHSFSGGQGGGSPFIANLVSDAKGNLYGTTQHGGAPDLGVAFKMTKTGGETVLHTFKGHPVGGPDGAYPYSGFVRDPKGSLYGTTYQGGTFGFGTVFKVTGGKETVLYNFTGGLDGGNPYASLILDQKGNLYGTTWGGGAFGAGTVFKLTPE